MFSSENFKKTDLTREKVNSKRLYRCGPVKERPGESYRQPALASLRPSGSDSLLSLAVTRSLRWQKWMGCSLVLGQPNETSNP
jgi:hypothetical protein